VSARWLSACYLLSILAPLCEALWPGLELVRGSYAALALAPWMVAALLPAQRAPIRPGALVHLAALVLPALLLGLGLDLERGGPVKALALSSLLGCLLLLAWSGARECAARTARTRRVYAWIWLAAVPGLAALQTALAWVPAREELPPDGALAWAALDPWIWWHRWALTGRASESLGECALALMGALLVHGILFGVGRGRPAEPAA